MQVNPCDLALFISYWFPMHDYSNQTSERGFTWGGQDPQRQTSGSSLLSNAITIAEPRAYDEITFLRNNRI